MTFCTARRAPLLVSDMACAACHHACRTLRDDGDAAILAATIMPDHVPLLLRLGARLTLDRVIAKWKAQVSRSSSNFAWQANYFEHRLRPEESVERYAWYVFMNPYRARLIGVDDCWPGWWPTSQSAWNFMDRARPGPRPRSRPTPQGDDQGACRRGGVSNRPSVRGASVRPSCQCPGIRMVCRNAGTPRSLRLSLSITSRTAAAPDASIVRTPPAERGNTRLPALSQSARMERNRSFSINYPKSAGQLDFNWQFIIELSDIDPVDRGAGACEPPLSLADEGEDTLTLYPIGIRSDIGYCLYSRLVSPLFKPAVPVFHNWGACHYHIPASGAGFGFDDPFRLFLKK